MSAAARVVLFGDGAWAARSLERLVEDGCDIAAVVERVKPSDSTLGDAARALKIPAFRPARASGSEFLDELSELAPDLALSISYDQILRRALLDIPRLGVVNFHAGMLPRYRGRNVINWAIINGEEEIGVTAHLVDEGIDTGDIILQRALPIHWTDYYGDLLERVVAAFPAIVSDTVREVVSGRAKPVPQEHSLATYYGKREVGDEWLDWSCTSREIYNKIRAISRPGPGARSTAGGREVVIWRASYDPAWPLYTATPGQVVGRCPDGSAIVKTGDSTIAVNEVEIAGGKSGSPEWRIGTRLGVNAAATLQALLTRMAALER